MTRQAQVVRSSSRSGPAAPRDLAGGAVIHCLLNTCEQRWYGGGSAGGIEVTAAAPYQRFYFSATIFYVHMFNPKDNASVAGYVALACDNTDLAVITVRDQFACLTGVTDLPEGTHIVETRVLPGVFGAAVNINGIAMQGIEGQVLQSPSCASPAGCAS